jgi:hypothetical protein
MAVGLNFRFGRSTEERADHPIGGFLKYTGRPVTHFFWFSQ